MGTESSRVKFVRQIFITSNVTVCVDAYCIVFFCRKQHRRAVRTPLVVVGCWRVAVVAGARRWPRPQTAGRNLTRQKTLPPTPRSPAWGTQRRRGALRSTTHSKCCKQNWIGSLTEIWALTLRFSLQWQNTKFSCLMHHALFKMGVGYLRREAFYHCHIVYEMI